MFNKGDLVEVIYSGEAYSNYTDMANKLGLTNFKSLSRVSNGFVGEIIDFSEHLEYAPHGIVYGIELDNGSQYLIGEKGLKLIKSYSISLPDNDKYPILDMED